VALPTRAILLRGALGCEFRGHHTQFDALSPSRIPHPRRDHGEKLVILRKADAVFLD
jgi:hypothetical protein